MRAGKTIFEDCAAIATELDTRLDALNGCTVLVTGANGFLMSYLIDALVAWMDAGDGRTLKVIAVDNLLTGAPDRLEHLEDRPEIRLVNHDITQPMQLDEDVHFIVHGASVASPMFYRQYPLETIDANVGGARHMLDLARSNPVRGMLMMSTSEIYGDPQPEFIPTPETYRGLVSCTGPRACYDESKRLTETLSVVYHQEHDVPVVMIRPFNVFGPGFRLDDKRVLPDFFTSVLAGDPIVLLSDGSPTRTFCYASDATRAMLLLLANPQGGEPFNVGSDTGEISMVDLAREVALAGQQVLGGEPVSVTAGKSDDPQYLTDNPNRRCPDLTKLRGIGWSPKVSLREGLVRTLESYRDLGLAKNS